MKTIGVIFFIFIAALFSTAVIIIGGPKYTMLLMLGVVGLCFLMLPPQWLLSMLIVYVYLIYGPINYFASIDTSWVPYLLGLELLFMAFLHLVTRKSVGKEDGFQKRKIPSYIWPLILLIIVASFSTATGTPNRYTLFLSVRSLFLIWGVYFVLSEFAFKPQYFHRLWQFLLAVGLLQLPMAIYQRLGVVPTRTDFAIWDSVIGTFPGNKVMGDSGGMAFFLIAIATTVISLWRYSQISGRRAILLVLLLISPIMFAEVKISYLLIPIMAASIFRSEIKRKPIYFFGGLTVALFLVVSVFFAGKYFNSTSGYSTQQLDMEKEFRIIFGYSIDIDAYAGVDMGRFKLLDFWWERNKSEPLRVAIGHGLGSSGLDKSYSLSGSEAWKYRPANIAHTTAAFLLWETGILGFLAYFAIHIFGALCAGQLAGSPIIPPFHRALLYSASVIIGSKILMIPYQLSSATTQVFFFILLGMVAFWTKQTREK